MSDLIEVRTRHKWRASGCGYDPSDYCDHCHVNNYDTRTEFCEDVADERRIRTEKQNRCHAETEAAWTRARSLLTKAEWALMELRERCGREYRVVDRI